MWPFPERASGRYGSGAELLFNLFQIDRTNCAVNCKGRMSRRGFETSKREGAFPVLLCAGIDDNR